MALPAGTRLGPYEIVGLLGAGGMGEVYRARDARLERDVALKVIAPALAKDPDRISRFEREAKAVAALSHPNILAIHDFGVHEGTTFAVMELLEGETLRERLKAGAIAPRKAAEIGAQIAKGLAAAHEKGIVHRDLKPENVFLSKDGHVKILDFGLASAAELVFDDRHSRSPTMAVRSEPGSVVGTTGYMSPEQVRGEPVDPRTDIFTLGAVLYELLTGKRAFHGSSPADTISAILKEDPPPIVPQGIAALPAGLESIVRRCMEKNPAERFQSARDLAFALNSAATRSTGSRPEPAGVPSKRSRAAVLLAAGAIAIAAAITIGVFIRSRGRHDTPSTNLVPKRIAVAVFENQTGDTSLDPLGRMVSDWITQGLSRVEGIQVAPSTTVLFAGASVVSAAAAARDPIRALAEASGAGTVVSGTYYLQGDTLRFQAEITDAVHGTLRHALDPVSAHRSAPMEAIDALRQQVMGAMAVDWGSDYSIVVQRPPRYDAYREFILGFELFLTDDAKALEHFDRAAQLDPSFLAPLFYAGFILHTAGDHARVDEILRELGGMRDQAPPLGRYWLDVFVAYTNQRFAEALQQARLAQKLAPEDPMIALWVGYMARLSNHPRQTVDTYDRFGTRPWVGLAMGVTWTGNLCVALHLLGEYRRELEEAHRGRSAGAGPFDLRDIEAEALAALDRPEEVDRVVDECLGTASAGDEPGAVALVAAAELRAHGNRDASLGIADRAASWYRGKLVGAAGNADLLDGLLDAMRWGEHWGEADSVCLVLLETQPANLRCLGIHGALAARLGNREDAMRAADELKRMTGDHLFGANTYRRACIAAVLGDGDEAVGLLRESFAAGVPYSLGVHREIDLEPLWGTAPFRELLQPKD